MEAVALENSRDTPTAPRRRWFQFGLRALFLIATIVALVAAWVHHQQSWIAERQRALVVESRFPYSWCFKWRDDVPQRRLAPWSLRIFGESGPDEFYVDRGMSDEARGAWKKHLQWLFPEAIVLDTKETWTQHHPPYSIPPAEVLARQHLLP